MATLRQPISHQLARTRSDEVVFAHQVETVQTFSSGCGGPSYGWTADGYIAIGDTLPQMALPPLVAQWAPLAAEAAAKFGLPLQYILGIIALESGGKPCDKSPAGALGIMQVMPKEVAKSTWMGRVYSTEELCDPATNIDVGCTLLANLWAKFGGDPIKIAFAYNAGWPRCGSGCVKDYKAPGQPCIAQCSPNQFGLVGDCYSTGAGTLDYGGRVAKYSNEALATGVATITPPDPLPAEEDEDGAGGGSSGLGWVLFGALSLGGVLLYTRG